MIVGVIWYQVFSANTEYLIPELNTLYFLL